MPVRRWVSSPPPSGSCTGSRAHPHHLPRDGRPDVVDPVDDVVDVPVLLRLLSGEPAVPPAVPLDGLHGLPGVVGDQATQRGTDAFQLLGVDLTVAGNSPDAR